MQVIYETPQVLIEIFEFQRLIFFYSINLRIEKVKGRKRRANNEENNVE